MRVHAYTAGSAAAVTHPDVASETRLRDLIVIEADERIHRVGEEIEVDIELSIIEIFGTEHGHVIAHPCREIAVLAVYGGIDKTVTAHPATYVRDVRAKAISEFGLDPASSADLVLRLPGTTTDLVPTYPIGAYAPKGTCSVTVDLVHLVRPQG